MIQETKRRFSWREGVMLMMVPLLLLVLGLSLSQPPSPKTSYQCYLSAPLPDGTRYTFLYPAWFDSVIKESNYVQLRHDETTTRTAKVLRAVGLQPPHDGFTFITAYTMPAKIKPPGVSGPRKQILWDNDKSISSQTIVTLPGKRHYILQHSASATASERFQEWDAVITDSFQMLPPGAPVPAP